MRREPQIRDHRLLIGGKKMGQVQPSHRNLLGRGSKSFLECKGGKSQKGTRFRGTIEFVQQGEGDHGVADMRRKLSGWG